MLCIITREYEEWQFTVKIITVVGLMGYWKKLETNNLKKNWKYELSSNGMVDIFVWQILQLCNLGHKCIECVLYSVYFKNKLYRCWMGTCLGEKKC